MKKKAALRTCLLLMERREGGQMTGEADVCDLCSIHTKFSVRVWLLRVYNLFDCHRAKRIFAVTLNAFVSFGEDVRMWGRNTFDAPPVFS